MIEYLSDILNGGVSRTPDDACFVIQQYSCKDDSNNNGGEMNDSEHTKTTTILRLSYRQAQEAQWQHQCWLAAQEKKIAATAAADATSSNTILVVAYLASNSIDYILSVMACASPIIIACTENKRFNNPTKEQHQRQHHPRRLLPALLNTRWTANEAVAALISGNNNNNNNRKNSNSTTNVLLLFLLYGPGFEVMATDIVAKLNNNDKTAKTKNRTTTCCCCLPIPTFAMQKVVLAGQRSHVLVQQQQQLQQQECYTINAESSSSCTTTGGFNNRPCCPVIDPEKEIQRLEDFYYYKRRHSRLPKINKADSNNNDDDHDQYHDEDDDTALIVFTSGTTSSSAGSSKGVKLGHISILIQALAKLKEPCLYSTDTVMLLASPSTVPFFHVGGLTSLLAVWLAGGTLLQVQNIKQNTHSHTRTTNGNGAFDPVVVLQSLQPASMMRTRKRINGRFEESTTTSPSSTSSCSSCCCYCNTLVLVPAMLHALQQQHQQHSSNNQQHVVIYPFVKLVLIGGQSASCALLDFARQYFPNARLVQTYACTEAASSITFCNITTKPAAAAPIRIMPTATATTATMMSTANSAGNYLSSGNCVGQPPSHIQVALLRMPPAQQNQHDSSTTTSNRNQQVMTRQQPKITSNMMIYQPWQVGVIATRGPHIMNGYWRDNSDNNNDCIDNITCDGWFITNDLGFWGFDKNDKKNNNAQQELDLYFCGRTTDTIRTGGETVMAPEVERVLLQHPWIDQVAVFDLPDEQYGQAVACAIVLAKNDNNNNKNHNHSLLLLDNVRQWCKQHGLAGYKCPRHVFYMTQLPRNSSGKVLKMRLRERFGHFSSSRVVTSKL